MKKELEDLNTYEFVALLLEHQPVQELCWLPPGSDDKICIKGTFDELYQEIIRLNDPFVPDLQFLDEYFFDYHMHLDDTDIIKYLDYRTDSYDHDMTEAFLKDMRLYGEQLFETIKDTCQTPEEFAQWKDSSASRYYEALNYLKRKSGCDGVEDRNSFSSLSSSKSANNNGTSEGVCIFDDCSVRVAEHLRKATSAKYIINERWHNNDKKEYAIFLKAFYCRVYRKDWDNNVRWKVLPIFPLANGTQLSINQIKGALRSYNNDADGGKRLIFERILQA